MFRNRLEFNVFGCFSSIVSVRSSFIIPKTRAKPCHIKGGCQNYGPLLGTLVIRCRIIIGTQKGTIILTTALKEGRRRG